jgi:hypothetical protein
MSDTLPTRNTTRIIQGVILRCVDGHWTDRDGLTPPAELLAMGCTRALQCWQNQKPVDSILEQPGEPLPDADELNSQIPQNEWELDPNNGQPKPPWVLQHICYLIDPHTAETYTFINSTKGAQIAVERLEDKFKWMRALRGNVVPIVKLDSRPMKTNFGQKMRPEFTVIEWRELGQNGGALEQKAVPQIEQAKPGPAEQLDQFATTKTNAKPATEKRKKATVGKPVKPTTIAEELDDEIGF